MDLKKIVNVVCPVCYSRTVAESCRSIHAHGDGFEVREFECGCILEWSPNFGRLETKKRCPKDPLEVERVIRYTNYAIDLLCFIRDMKAPDDWKGRVMFHLPYEVTQHKHEIKNPPKTSYELEKE